MDVKGIRSRQMDVVYRMEQNRNRKNDSNRQIGVAQACAAFPFPARSGNEEIGSDYIMEALSSGEHLYKDTTPTKV